MGESDIPLEALEELLGEIRTYSDSRRAAGEWKQVYRLLGRTDLDPRRYNGIVGMRDVEGLEKLIDELREPASAAAEDAPDAATCRKALQAFKKRARLTRLDDESQLGRGPLSKGADTSLGAVTPPADFPDAVWQELVRQGRLRYLGHGLYELASGGQ